ncbi:hypothetical protein BC833DRAFT_600930 [Globomyces pollinis-pini]|nr:hypothetical protein BC833DRAFT_600930 [Globomyces pollinis-pini]
MIFTSLLLQTALSSSITIVPPSTKIFGLGWALFISIVFMLALLTVCLVLSKQDYAQILYIGSALIFGLFVLIVSIYPKIQVGSYLPPPVVEIDWTFYPKLFLVIFTFLFSLIGIGGITVTYVLQPIYAISPE